MKPPPRRLCCFPSIPKTRQMQERVRMMEAPPRPFAKRAEEHCIRLPWVPGLYQRVTRSVSAGFSNKLFERIVLRYGRV
jgi:hypothetical protein